jgi:hypothetical protein
MEHAGIHGSVRKQPSFGGFPFKKLSTGHFLSQIYTWDCMDWVKKAIRRWGGRGSPKSTSPLQVVPWPVSTSSWAQSPGKEGQIGGRTLGVIKISALLDNEVWSLLSGLPFCRLSNLWPLWFWDYSSRLYKGKHAIWSVTSTAAAKQQHCHFVGAPSSCVQQKVKSKRPVFFSSARYFSLLWRISELREPIKQRSLFELIY